MKNISVEAESFLCSVLEMKLNTTATVDSVVQLHEAAARVTSIQGIDAHPVPLKFPGGLSRRLHP